MTATIVMTRTVAVLVLVISVQCATVAAKDRWTKFPAANPQDMQRSGNANQVRKNAILTYQPSYGGYYVGGGAASRRASTRYNTEGTFGMDYVPWYSRVVLGWSHGEKYQDGRGLYEPDHHNHPFNNFRKRGSEAE